MRRAAVWLIILTACSAHDDPSPIVIAHEATSATPGRLACPSSVRDGAACGAPMTCEDESCGLYSCDAGKWTRLSGDGPCRTASARNDCPVLRPSIGDWCSASATCTYDDTCSQRPAAVAKVTLHCNGYDWSALSKSYDVVCPAAAPHDGDACEPSCSYPRCDYGCGVATCDAKTATWKIEGCSP